jgi:23S rRNA pseudouridine2605 synthase
VRIRLNKLLAERGLAARRKCDLLIEEGRVRVDGQVVTELGTRVDPVTQRITVSGRPLPDATAFAYYAFHKPLAVVTTLSDPRGRRTVRDFLQPTGPRLFPVGRLDYDTSGLLLLTNDGALAHRLMHPRYHVPKTYRLQLAARPSRVALDKLGRGFEYAPGERSRPAEVGTLRAGKSGATLELTIREGRHRQIRRMCEALDLELLGLTRLRFGPVALGPLAPGRLRRLTKPEVSALRRAVHTPTPVRRGRTRGAARRSRPARSSR